MIKSFKEAKMDRVRGRRKRGKYIQRYAIIIE